MKKYLLALLVSCSSKLCAQLTHDVTMDVNFNNTPLEGVLDELRREHGMMFSYGFDNIDSTTPISISRRGITIAHLLGEICRQAKITYIIIDKMIVFKAVTQVDSYQSPTLRSTAPPARFNAVRKRVVSQGSEKPRSILTSPTLVTVIKPVILPSTIPIQTRSSQSQRIIGITINPVVDFNFYDYKPRDLDFQFYRHGTNTGIGTGLYYLKGNKWLMKTGISWARKDFSLYHNYMVFDPSDPIPIPDVTTVQVNYTEIPLAFGYSIFRRKQMSVWITSGIYFLNQSNGEEKTTYQNRSQENTTYFLPANLRRLFSGSLGLGINRKIISKASLFLEPEFIFYSAPINSEVMNSSVSAFRLNAGVAYRVFIQ